MRKLLDKLLLTKWAYIIPLGLASIVYLLFLFFSDSESKSNLLTSVPFACAVGFLGVFAVIFVQIKNPHCPAWFLDGFEILAILVFGLSALWMLIGFIASRLQTLNPLACLGLIVYSAVALAHRFREK